MREKNVKINWKLRIKTTVLWVIPFILIGYVGEKLFPGVSIPIISGLEFLCFLVIYGAYRLLRWRKREDSETV
ncbi:MAG: hypothetical protein CO090_01740 [Acidobacteria bacterium CG_4_9_14_3_um_filter_49_7]|nr:MAG: hypothetical protein CO090_01740 [Acidobacteria bacterium CG_4_9_14_3_um_filter_49_7]